MLSTDYSKAVELSSFVLLLVLMPVSVPLSYECAVYFLIKNVHFILSSVKVARGQNVVHLQNVVFLLHGFLEVHILATTYQKAFILRPYVPCRVLFHSMTSDPRVHCQGRI